MIKCGFPNKALCCRNENGLYELEVLVDELSLFSLDECFVAFLPIPISEEDYRNFLPKEKRFFFHRRTAFPLEPFGIKGWRLTWSIKLFFLTDRCSRLTPDNRCSVYSKRPLLCKGYPLITTVPEVFTDPFYYCRKCCKQVEVLNPDRYISKLENLYRPRLKEHKEVFRTLTEQALELFPELKDSFLEMIKEIENMNGNNVRFPVNLTANILFAYALFDIEGLEIQVGVLEKLIEKLKVYNPIDVEPMTELLSEYRKGIEILRDFTNPNWENK